MHSSSSSFGTKKHRTSGVAVSVQHFTGKKGGKRVRRKKKVKAHTAHVNKYA